MIWISPAAQQATILEIANSQIARMNHMKSTSLRSAHKEIFVGKGR